jgi:hypothetical protein
MCMFLLRQMYEEKKKGDTVDMYNVGHLVKSNYKGPLNINHQKMTKMVDFFYK